MRFSNTFKIVWWLLIVLPLTTVLAFRVSAFVTGDATAVDMGLVAIWALLFVAPIYVEVSFGGVTLKQQIESVREEIRADVASIRNELHTIVGISTQVSPQFTVTTPPSNADLPVIEQRVKAAVAEAFAAHGLPAPQPPTLQAIEPPRDVAFLFGVRYHIDHELTRIAEEQGLEPHPRRRYGLGLARELGSLGIIDQRLVGAILEVYRVCSPAIHGEEPNPKQVSFVRDVGPNVLAALKLVRLSDLDRAFDSLRARSPRSDKTSGMDVPENR